MSGDTKQAFLGIGKLKDKLFSATITIDTGFITYHESIYAQIYSLLNIGVVF